MNELLEKAKQMYPIGMKFRSVFDGAEHLITKPIFAHYGNIYTVNDDFEFICLYRADNNKWAEIIKEETMNELLEKAKQMYPIGTKFISMYKINDYVVTKSIFIRYENVYTIDENGDIRCLYDKVLNKWAEIIKEETMTQEEFNDLKIGDFISNHEVLHKYNEFLIVRCDDGHDLVDLAKINKLGLKLQPKTFMGLEIKKYDNVPCEINNNELYYLFEVCEKAVLLGVYKYSRALCCTPTSIRIL
jgi:hypothetical protein